MKKRLLSWLMVLTLCLTLLPTAAFAVENEDVSAQSSAQESKISTQAAAAHVHCRCGATHKAIGDHTDANASSLTFTAWTDELAAEQYSSKEKTAANSLPSTGNDFYYLTKDVELSTSWKPADGTVLCLNGYSITSTSYNCGIMIDNGVTFTLTDCNGSNKTYHFSESYKRWKLDESGNHTVTGGIITSTGSGSGSGVLVQNGGVFNMYGGTIVGNRGTTVSTGGTSGGRGGGVYVKDANSRFNLYGGAITGNTAGGGYATLGGGGVFVNGGEFTMYGGEITNNAATANADNGGGVQVLDNGTFNMTGGTIGGEGKGNTSGWSGGGVYVNGARFKMSGDAAIIGNSARSGGSGVDMPDGTFTMSGNAKIVNNKETGTSSNGGGVCVSNGTFTMSDNAAITGNSCGSTRYNGGGVFVGSTVTFTVSGNVQITDNTKGSDSVKNNVYLPKDKTITIDGALTGEIGVTAREPAAGLAIATGATENKDYTEIITSDDDTYEVAHDSTDATKLVLKVAPEKPHTHFLCTTGTACTGIGGHTENGKTTFATKLWMDGDTLKMGDNEWKPTTTTVGSNNPSLHYVLSEGSYYLGSDIKLTESIHIREGVQLCLNGFSIISDGTVTGRHVIIVEGSSLTLTDCKGSGKITHADKKNGGVSVYNPSSVFNMFGGIITGNNIDGGVLNGGTFNMYGGEISGNTATNCGGGVYVAEYSTAFKVSGSAKITGNTVDEKANNIYLPSGKTIAISGLTGGANIGVTTAEKPEGSKTVTIASSVGELNYENYVKADDSEKYEVKRSNGDLVLAVKNGSGTTPAKHEHYLCGGSESCTCPVTETKKVEFQPWTDTEAASQNGTGKTAANSLPNTAGNYYLTGPVTLVDSYWEPKSGTVLCLNGYSITLDKDTKQDHGVIYVTGGFTLADCKGEQGEYGKITHGKDTDGTPYDDCGVTVRSGSFTMYGGNITGNETRSWAYGCGVYVGHWNNNPAGTFTMYGGKISGNKAQSSGGGVYAADNFTMYGGEISDNEAGDGGGVYVSSGGTFTMNGGTISNNEATYSGAGRHGAGGGGVFIEYAGRFTMEKGLISKNKYTGTGSYPGGGGVYVQQMLNYEHSTDPAFTMKGGTISDNETNYAGGGVYVGEYNRFTMEGGTISNNKAFATSNNGRGEGGGVYAYGSFTMRGGEISGNNCDGSNYSGYLSGDGCLGGGVYVATDDDAAMTVSGNVKITGNTKSPKGGNSEKDNVYLPGKTITIGGALTGEAGSIGVTTSTEPKEKRPVTIAAAGTGYTIMEADQDKFTSDNNDYEVKYDNGKLVLALKDGGTHEHVWNKYVKNENEVGRIDLFCSGCNESGGCVKITAPTNCAYTGDPIPAELEISAVWNGGRDFTDAVGYSDISEFSPRDQTAPKDIGRYRAYLTLGEDNNFARVYIEYEITEGGSTNKTNVSDKITFKDGELTYTGSGLKYEKATIADGYTGSFSYTYEVKNGGSLDENGLPVGVGTYTVTAKYEDTNNVGTKTATLTVKAASTPSTPSTPSSGSSTGSSTITKTETTTNPDGSVTKTEIRPDGTVIETTTNPDGSTSKTESKTTTKSNGSTVETVTETNTGADGSKSTSKTETTTAKDGSKTETKSETKTEADGTKSETKSETKTDANGVTSGTETTKTTAPNGSTGTTTTTTENGNTKTEAEAKVSEKAIEDAKKSGEAVKVPTEVKAGENSNSAPTVKVELPKNAGETKIEIPVSDVNSGTVAVIVHPDGTEEIVKDSKPTADGVELTVNGSATVKVIDNSKDFIDTRNHWSRDEVNFVASREIFNGVGNNLFGVSQPMTRGMVNTVLARLAGIDTTPENGQKWYEVGTEWAKANGITDGTNPEASVTREQLATLLYRFCGTPEVSGVLSFADAGEVSDYAQSALLWATQNDILNGVGNNRVAPNADAQRAQVAAMMARYLKNAG